MGKTTKLGAAGMAGVLAILAAGSASAATNLVVNGNFSQPDPGAYNQGGWNQSVSIPGWTSNTSDTIETGLNSTYGFSPSSTTVDTNLEVNDNTFGSVSQTFTDLVAGQTYDLSWAYGNRPGSGPQELFVQWDGGTVLTEAGGTPGYWFNTGPFAVVASASGTDTLTFSSMDEGGLPSYGNEITAVSLTSAVPEPMTWAMMLVGLGGIGVAMRSRRRLAGAVAA